MARQLVRIGACLSSLLALSSAYPEDAKSLYARSERRLAEFGELSEQLVKREDERAESFFEFVTRPDIQAPRWEIQIMDRSAMSEGHWFFAPYSGLNQEKHEKSWVGPYIYDEDGELIWSGTSLFQHWNVFDFHPVRTNGEDYLSLLYVHENSGIMLNSSYERFTTQPLNPPNGPGDMHEFHVLPNGTAMAITLDPGPASVAQSLKVGYDGECKAKWRGFVEIDLATKKEIFRWNARNHIALEESMKYAGSYKNMCEDGWDLLHLNSMDKFPDGDYLLSSRHTNALYKINHHNGSIVWRLGGTKNDFQKDFIFSRQHHARVQSQNASHTVVSIFDNAIGTEQNETATNDLSRGLMMLLRTDKQPMTAEIIKEYDHPKHRITNSRGSLETMPNNNVFICWTYGSLVTESTADGRVIMQAHTKGGFNTYRMFKKPWVGKPRVPPDVISRAVEKFNPATVQTVAYVSWNGATEVKTWNMHRSNQNGSYTEFLVSSPRRGFETMVTYKGYASYVVLEGLDSDGASLGKSPVIMTARPSNMNRTLVEEDAQWLEEHTEQQNTDALKTADDNFTAEPVDSTPDSPYDPKVWAEKAQPLLTSSLACYIYGIITALFVGWITVIVRRRRGNSKAWWARIRGNNSGDSYDPVWESQSVEMLSSTDEDPGKEERRGESLDR